MAKTKEQKRKEALDRQYESLLRAINDWCSAAIAASFDAEDLQLVNRHLINSAYAARCDRYGNYLDKRYYKNNYRHADDCDPKVLALEGDIKSLEELKTQTNAYGQSLYRIAYGYTF